MLRPTMDTDIPLMDMDTTPEPMDSSPELLDIPLELPSLPGLPRDSEARGLLMLKLMLRLTTDMDIPAMDTTTPELTDMLTPELMDTTVTTDGNQLDCYC